MVDPIDSEATAAAQAIADLAMAPARSPRRVASCLARLARAAQQDSPPVGSAQLDKSAETPPEELASGGGLDARRVGGDSAPERVGNWMQTVGGRAFYPLDPRPEDVSIEDIAHALSFVCRFGGHCTEFYSVAEHCVRVSEAIEAAGGTREECFVGLMHDAAEAYVGDMVWPLKQAVGPMGYKSIEKLVEHAIADRFDLPHAMPAIVKHFDLALLSTEKRDLMTDGIGREGGSRRETQAALEQLGAWHSDGVAALPKRIEPWAPELARRHFLARFSMFTGDSEATKAGPAWNGSHPPPKGPNETPRRAMMSACAACNRTGWQAGKWTAERLLCPVCRGSNDPLLPLALDLENRPENATDLGKYNQPRISQPAPVLDSGKPLPGRADDLTDIGRAAEAAKQAAGGGAYSWYKEEHLLNALLASRGDGSAVGPEQLDAAFIALANPTRVLALVAQLRELRAKPSPAYLQKLEARVLQLCALIDDLHHALGKRAAHNTPEITAACVKSWILDAKSETEPLL